MAYALSKPRHMSRLIVADIAPSNGSMSTEFTQYISLMQEIENLPPGKIKTRSDADKILSSYKIVSRILTYFQNQLSSGRIHLFGFSS